MAEGGPDEVPVGGPGSLGEKEGKTQESHTSSKSGKKARRKKRDKHKARASSPGGTDSTDGKTSESMTVGNISTKNLQEILSKLTVEEKERSHAFWDTQPVPKLEEKVSDVGPLEDDKEHVRPDPLTLPEKFVWDVLDLGNADQLSELYTLLCENYVEDEDNMFRFDYSRSFLQWALRPPGWKQEWHCGVRVATNKKLVGFISAVPAVIRIREREVKMVEINFLCVHKKLRSKRVAPVLIKEITRRVNLEGIFQAVYTAGILLPKPVAVCRYWHRSINPKKLVEVQFSSLQRNMTLQRMIRLYRLPEETRTPGLRPLERRDVPTVFRLLNEYLSKFEMVPVFQSEEEVEYWFTPKDSIIVCYVVEDPESQEVTDMVSFYHLPSTVVHHPVHKALNVAYSFYYFHTKTPLKDLLQDALIIAKQLGSDVFNALDVMENKGVLEELKFGMGDGNLHYYFYNWKCPEIDPTMVGLVLQ